MRRRSWAGGSPRRREEGQGAPGLPPGSSPGARGGGRPRSQPPACLCWQDGGVSQPRAEVYRVPTASAQCTDFRECQSRQPRSCWRERTAMRIQGPCKRAPKASKSLGRRGRLPAGTTCAFHLHRLRFCISHIFHNEQIDKQKCNGKYITFYRVWLKKLQWLQENMLGERACKGAFGSDIVPAPQGLQKDGHVCST